MWEAVKIKVESLTPEAFAPFGHVIHSADERKPEVAIGGLGSNDYEVRAELGDEANGEKAPLTEGRQRAHFAFHTDAGQSFFPTRGRPAVFLVGPVQDSLAAGDVRAFYSDGSVGICMHLKVWHTMPICLEGVDVFRTTRGDQDYQAHSVEVDFDLEQGLAVEPDMENFDPTQA